jgi:hypothetical protein
MYLPYVQYLPHAVHMVKPVFDRFSVIFTIAIVWLYAYILTVSGAYKNARTKTQVHCRVDRSGLISGASWLVVYVQFMIAPHFAQTPCFHMIHYMVAEKIIVG